MRYAELIDAVRVQGTALRESVGRAAPDIPLYTCPGTVRDLLANLGAWYGSVLSVTGGERPKIEPSSGSWADNLRHWDQVFAALLAYLDNVDLERGEPTQPSVRQWARRVAHETAIRRLDADSVVKDLPTLVFGTEFAADGIDEFLSTMSRRPASVAGTVLYHAADAGRVWQVRLDVGEPPVTMEPIGSGVDVDLSVVGTADAVYRSVWGRPSTAVVTGDRSLLAAVTPP
jgi:hypothetical protein